MIIFEQRKAFPLPSVSMMKPLVIGQWWMTHTRTQMYRLKVQKPIKI